MFAKLAARNVKKSIRDYMVYFLTLMLGVCIFYVFNSIEAQGAMMDIEASGGKSLAIVTSMMNVVSVLVSFVLAFLVIYANNFMIKRRKRELGLYMTLGMPQSKISGMLVLETLAIGAVALAAGLLLGIFLSQGLAVLTAKLFEVQIVDFHFIFSSEAFLKSILYFGVIFIVVILFNSRSIAKYKLIDMLYADRKNEALRVRRTGPSIALFAVGIFLIIVSYWFVISGGAAMILYTFGPGIVINVAGTLLFFMSLSGLLIKSVQSNKKVYFKGLNMFVLRQLGSKVNTNFVSMTFICTMLFLTIVILSTVTSFNSVFSAEAKISTAYDVSFTIAQNEGGDRTTVRENLPALGIDENQLFGAKHEYNVYETGVRMVEVAEPFTEYLTEEAKQKALETTTLEAIKLTDFNELAKMQGVPQLTLGENEFASIATQKSIKGSVEEYIANPHPIVVNGREMMPAQLPVQQIGLWTTQTEYMDIMLIVPDAVAEGLVPTLDVYVANYGENVGSSAEALAMLGQNIEKLEAETGIKVRTADKVSISQANAGLTTSLIFVGIYLGLIFLIAGAAVLALQQLSGAADNKGRYDLLKKLGAEEKMINASLLSQVGLYFFLPLLLAMIHSAVGMHVMNSGIFLLISTNVMGSSMIAALFIALVYGGYFLATYFGCKNIVHAKYERRG